MAPLLRCGKPSGRAIPASLTGMRRARWIGLLLTLCSALPAAAQAPGQVSIRFQKLGIDEGLSQATARTLVQDRGATEQGAAA